MQGDFSRGHRPDAKRGMRYLRGFAQQRRLLLDSDLNGMTDAIHERLRELSRQTGCPKGSPDLGYLVTPGRLLALFRDLDGVTPTNVTMHRDYGQKYLDRYPSLHIAADLGVAGSVTIRLREPADGEFIFWCRAEAPTNVQVVGAIANPIVVPAGDLQAVTVDFGPIVPAVEAVQINLDPGAEIWIALIEKRQPTTLAPKFDFAAGYFHLDGLPLKNDAEATWQTSLIPPPDPDALQVDDPARDLANGDLLLAYLEGWEQHITFVEDGGILENALGGDTDTTTRGRAIGQVKLAWAPADFDFANALDNPTVADGTLNVTTPPAVPDPDPCALPVQGGYTGRDNRFYRFEVHLGGPLGTALLKWSRDNAFELFRATTATDQELTFPANTLLRSGDLVEVLTEAIELGDEAPAALDFGAGSFTPSVRAVGRLVKLKAVSKTDSEYKFTMTAIDGVTVATLDAHFGPFPSDTIKVRRWHGFIQTTVAPAPNVAAVENGINIELDGTFTAGDYWQYEARADRSNTNGDFQITPHGPERDFAPLALLQFVDEDEPLLLRRWLDHRFPPLCELTADDIAFDGDHIGSESDTVQEIIEELWEKVGGGCCEFTLSPPPGDAAAAIRDILDETTGEVTICLEPGIYSFTTVLAIAGRKVGLKGCPRAVLTAEGIETMISVGAAGRLQLENLVLFGQDTGGPRVLVDVGPAAGSVEARSVGFFAVPRNIASPPITLAIRVNGQEPAVISPSSPVPLTTGVTPNPNAPVLRLHDCVVGASWGISATALGGLDISDSLFSCTAGCVSAQALFNCRVRATDLIAGENLAAMQAWTAESLLANADELIAQLASVGDVPVAPVTGSACVRSLALAHAMFENCRFIAGLGLAATNAQFVSLRANAFRVSSIGVHLVNASETVLEGGWISNFTDGGGLAAFGVRLVLRGGFSMTDTSVRGFNIGVALGVDSGVANARGLLGIQIQANQIADTIIGIQLGPNNANTYSGELRQVAITENNVTANAVGILVNALAALSGSSPGAADVRVADNLVMSRIGVGVIGRHVAVSNNRIHLVTGSGRRFGVIASNTENLVCESNQVELRAAGGAVVMFASALNASALALAGAAFSAYLSSAGNSVALQIVNGSAARVGDNAVHIENNGLNLMGIAASNHARLAVKGNEFLAGSCDCVDTDDLVFLDNTVLGNVLIRSAHNGMACDNRVREVQNAKVPGDLLIDTASGRWKVADNRADGTIRIFPAASYRFSYTDFLASAFEFNVAELPVLHEMAGLSGDPVFGEMVRGGSETVSFSVAGDEPAASAAAAADELTVGAGHGSDLIAMRDGNWVEAQESSLSNFVLAGATKLIKALGPDYGLVLVGHSQESAFDVMFTGNWANNLQIGTSSSARPSAASVVQVVANRADSTLWVKAYPKLLGAMNVAGNYTGRPLDNSASVIASPNLNI